MKSFFLLLLFFHFFTYTNSQVFLDEKVANLLEDNLLEMESLQATNPVAIQQISNDAYTHQSGSMLISVLQQTGQNNEANLWQEGNSILHNILQTGDNNVINSYIRNSSLFEKTAFLIQNGDNNRLDLVIFGNEIPTASQSIKITQEGNGFEAKAVMESCNIPIEITQKAGHGGGEMKVDVSTSCFYFPMK